MSEFNLEEIKAEAKKQLAEEAFQKAVEDYKEKLRKATIWDRIWPWKIIVVKKDTL